MANATRGLVTPVAAARPSGEDDATLAADVPARPESAVTSPSASTPRPIARMSARNQLASLVRCAAVMTAIAFIVEAIAAIRNAASRRRSNAMPKCSRSGGAKSGTGHGSKRQVLQKQSGDESRDVADDNADQHAGHADQSLGSDVQSRHGR